MKTIRIPQRFYDYHVDRDLDAPAVVGSNKRHYYIESTDDHIMELYREADEFCYNDDPANFGLVSSACATCKAMEKTLEIY